MTDVRLRRVVEELLRPSDRLEQLDRRAHVRRVRSDVGRGFELTPGPAPPERGTEVGQLRAQPVDGLPPRRAVPPIPPPHGLVGEERRVAVAHLVERSRRPELALGELSNRLEQRVARPTRRVVDVHERLAHERVDKVEHDQLVSRAEHGGDRGDVETALEHGGGPEQ